MTRYCWWTPRWWRFRPLARAFPGRKWGLATCEERGGELLNKHSPCFHFNYNFLAALFNMHEDTKSEFIFIFFFSRCLFCSLKIVLLSSDQNNFAISENNWSTVGNTFQIEDFSLRTTTAPSKFAIVGKQKQTIFLRESIVCFKIIIQKPNFVLDEFSFTRDVVVM